jgi:beta-phosphoglucomutase-like phosphatase (HAD superfamily)
VVTTQLVIFDLDNTMVDTTSLEPFRKQRNFVGARANVSKTSVFLGVAELIRELDQRAILWAVLTRSPDSYAWAVLEHHKLVAKRPKMIAYHDVSRAGKRQKPAPDGCLMLLQEHKLDPQFAIGVGDDATDVPAYRGAGVRAIGAGWSPTIARNAGWDQIADAPADVLGLL